MKTIKLTKQEEFELFRDLLTCKRCGHKWLPRINMNPKTCPKCRSPYWNQERRIKQ